MRIPATDEANWPRILTWNTLLRAYRPNTTITTPPAEVGRAFLEATYTEALQRTHSSRSCY